MRSLVHLSDFILGLNPFLVVFTPVSHFSASPLICFFCVESRFYTGFGFLSSFLFFFLKIVLFIILCVNFLFIMYSGYTPSSPGTLGTSLVRRYSWYLSGSPGTLGTFLVQRVLLVPLWFTGYSWYLSGSAGTLGTCLLMCTYCTLPEHALILWSTLILLSTFPLCFKRGVSFWSTPTCVYTCPLRFLVENKR